MMPTPLHMNWLKSVNLHWIKSISVLVTLSCLIMMNSTGRLYAKLFSLTNRLVMISWMSVTTIFLDC